MNRGVPRMVLVASLVGFGCGGATAPATTPPLVASIDARPQPTEPWSTLPSGAVVEDDLDDADASSLGRDVRVALARQYRELRSGVQSVALVLQVGAVGASAADALAIGVIGFMELVYDEPPPAPGTAEELAAYDGEQPWTTPHADIDPPPGRVLYEVMLPFDHGYDLAIVVHDQDRLTLLTYTTDHGESSEAWEPRATVRLAAAAVVEAR